MPSRPQHVLGEGRNRWAVVVAALLVVAFGISLCWRGIVISDEGYLLLQALDLRNGSVLYRDMDAFVTPGIWLLLAGLFSVVEPSVFASRFLALFCFLGTIGVSYVIVLRIAGLVYALAGVFALLVLSVWAFPAWTFSFYSPFAVMFALLAMERVLAWSRSQRIADLVWVGLLLGLSISFKQNYGAYALIGAAIAICATHRETFGSWGQCLRKTVASAWPVAAGLAVIGIPLLAYFAYEGAFFQLIDSLVVRPFVFAGLHDIAYPGISRAWDPTFMQFLTERLTYGSYALSQTPPPLGLAWLIPVTQRLHVLLYWVPPVILLGGLALSVLPKASASRIDTDLFTVIVMSGFLFLGVFPRADFNHLINVYQPIAIAGVVATHRLLARWPAPRSWWINFALGLGSVFLALCVLVAGSWYTSLVRSMTQNVDVPRGGVLLNPLHAELLSVQVDRIQANTAPGESLLTVPDIAMLNFLAERPMPGRYYNLYEHHISRDRGAGVVEAAEREGVRWAAVRMNNFFSDRTGLREYAPDLANYLNQNFDIDYVFGRDGFLFLEKRETPRPERGRTEVLGDCEDLDPEIHGGHVISTHLLFDALYLYPGSKGPPKTAEARCRVLVPEQGELVMRIGFLQPEKVDPNTWALAEVMAERNGELEPLFIKMFTITPRGFMEWGKKPYSEFRVDLSQLAGEEVTLVFRTTRSGDMHFGLLDISSFAMTWEDPRIERAAPAR